MLAFILIFCFGITLLHKHVNYFVLIAITFAFFIAGTLLTWGNDDASYWGIVVLILASVGAVIYILYEKYSKKKEEIPNPAIGALGVGALGTVILSGIALSNLY